MARRTFCDPLPDQGPVELPAEAVRHLRVVRTAPGAELVLFDGRGREARAVLEELGRSTGRARIEETRKAENEPIHRVELAFPAPKGPRTEWLLEHGTEVGIARFRPITTRRSRSQGQKDRTERWLRILRNACEQCDRGLVPTLDAEVPLEELCADVDLPTHRYLADLDGTAPLRAPAEAKRSLLLVGPEGGFEDGERALLRAQGFEPIHLGPLTLRVETAALVGAARLLSSENARVRPSANEW